MKLSASALKSIIAFLNLVRTGELHLRRDRLLRRHEVRDGKSYAVFRETILDRDFREQEVTLVVAFRLIVIGSNPFWHWLFQRGCILNTPIWCGFKGFRAKLWMVEPRSRDYLGIYRYQGRSNARAYAEYICSILRPLSRKGSVWYEVIEKSFEQYLAATSVEARAG